MVSAATSEREQWLRAVTQDGLALYGASAIHRADKGIVLAAVRQNGHALLHAADRCKSDREVVLAAVKQNGDTLCNAADSCKSDHEIVLTAVTCSQHGPALFFAAESCKSDPEIVLAAVMHDGMNLEHAAESYKSDREIVDLYSADDEDCDTAFVIERACSRLGLDEQDTSQLIRGSEVVSDETCVLFFLGLQPLGQVTEYQLVL
mmetsp:Transcript_53465/g.98900  ORF Transcript_53465/g.98900 Transcript_53465/m.98900 type:complete len:205 (+) Transcript_53465:81-695(+)